MLREVRVRGKILLAVLGLPGRRCAGCGDPDPCYVCPTCRDVFCNHCVRAGHRHAESHAVAARPVQLGHGYPGAARGRRLTRRGAA